MTDTATSTSTATGAAGAPAGRTRPTRIAAIVVGVVVALLVVLLATRNPAGERIASADLMGKPAPAIGGEVVLGEPFDLGATDRWVVVNFFATWCVPCQQEHPELRAFSEEHEETGDARVVSVVYDEQPAAVKEFFERKGGDWTVFDADEGRTAVDWGVAKVPESYLVSPTGIVVERFVGGVTQQGLDAVIDAYERAAAEQSNSGDGS